MTEWALSISSFAMQCERKVFAKSGVAVEKEIFKRMRSKVRHEMAAFVSGHVCAQSALR